MECLTRGSGAITERSDRTARGYRRFRGIVKLTDVERSCPRHVIDVGCYLSIPHSGRTSPVSIL
jgi:hypothetical protein